MGAGAGKRRRVQAAVTQDLCTWDDFCRAQGLNNVNVHAYYEIAADANGVVSPEESARLVREIFHDFVTMEVLTLHYERLVEDYFFVQEYALTEAGVMHDQVFIEDLITGAREGVVSEPEKWFPADVVFDHWGFPNILTRFETILNSTLLPS